MALLRPACSLLLLLALITGGVYPLFTTLLAQALFPAQANGSPVVINGQLRGSRLIGQAFDDANYFHGRPSATAEAPYNPMASGGSNLAVSNPALDAAVRARVAALRAATRASRSVPVELVTTSGSGLDNAISPAAARWQIPRVAAARQLSAAQLEQLINNNTTRPPLDFLGEPVVNVLQLNLALDALSKP